jgi:hydrogenase expression/formation protein HypD
MKYLDEFRDAARVHALAGEIAARTTRPWTIMEVCGGQTHAIMRFGLDQLLPAKLQLVHGPGCPVCVTPQATLDAAIRIASSQPVSLCVYADMLRVPGAETDLLSAKARGADVRIVAGPLEALELARSTPERQVVFLAVGFETTAPAGALAVLQADALQLRNFSLLVSHFRVPEAIDALLRAPDSCIQAFLAAGHVCSVMGTAEYPALCAQHGVPIVITGFEPVDVMQGVLDAVTQLEAGRAEVSNAYARAVQPEGNPSARAALSRVFEIVDQTWRGLGVIPSSGFALREAYAGFDARRRFASVLHGLPLHEPPTECIAGQVLSGHKRPDQCPAFGTRCQPSTPLGAPMVSNEGACAAYFRYRRHGAPAATPRFESDL